MPVVGIPVSRLKQLVGQDVPKDDLRRALEQLGNDVEGYARVTRYECDRCGNLIEVLEHEEFGNACPACGSDALNSLGTSDVIRIDLLPVRPDMYDVAGLARALRGYLGIETGLPVYNLTDSGYRVEVKPGLEEIRPHIVAAVVRGLKLDDELVRIVMKMQENLHWALGRDRRRASIGVYDLATVKPGFVYRPVEPGGIEFVPLGGLPDDPAAALTPRSILEQHPKGKAYAHLLQDMKLYPLLTDSTGAVLSMPPIINSDATKVTGSTTDFFVDVTGPDRHAIAKSLSVLVTSLADFGGRIETVTVAYPDSRTETTPDLAPAVVELDPKSARTVVGVDIPAPDIARILERLRYGAEPDADRLKLQVPAYRSDVMHEYDILEDVAIGYGYENIKPRLVPTMTVGGPQPAEELAATARRALVGLGFLEVMTLVLANPREQFELLRIPEPAHPAIENPISVDGTMPRVHLLTGLLTTFRTNTAREMPQQIFEVGDCFELDEAAETGIRTRKKAAAGIAGPKAGFAEGRAVLTALARELGIAPTFAPSDHPAFIPGRAARILEVNGDEIGVLGEIHPEVLERFGINQPVVAFETQLTIL